MRKFSSGNCPAGPPSNKEDQLGTGNFEQKDGEERDGENRTNIHADLWLSEKFDKPLPAAKDHRDKSITS
jgi:hypothetical protein